ncbi:MAG: DUF455 family protein [Gammaproteobacteria bacterium]|nr:MAG: DUF455 family protein [Gammaproteobacteria bacterium]
MDAPALTGINAPGELRAAALVCLETADPEEKCRCTETVYAALQSGRLAVDPRCRLEVPLRPGRPERPRLVPPARVPRRRPGSRAGRIALIHAVVHIEFNAVNLAWDAVARFPGMPEAFYRDWARVAAEEARHFRLLARRLASLGAAYGDLPAHDGLWEMALATRDDVLERMALVPRVLEARGLDVTPGMIERLRAAGDGETAAVLERILEEEIGHVALGSHWFRYCCTRRGWPPRETFRRLVRQRMRGRIKPPLHRAARRAAGFTERELEELEAMFDA